MRTRNVSGRPQLPTSPKDTRATRHQAPIDFKGMVSRMTPADRLLAEIAIRLQLSRTDYDKAVQRYQTISRRIEHDRSPLRDRVERFYPQGSMAISATIAARGTDEFDIDVVAQLALPEHVRPRDVLDLLYEAVRGEIGSRYYEITKRQTRCITVEYQDNMHIDITPAVRRPRTPERESWICHDPPEERYDVSERLIANPYGFAEWFKRRTPTIDQFANLYMARAAKYEQTLIAAQAETEPVPAQEPPAAKSTTVVALQLLKRWRNVQYESRPGRRPPSVMISKLVADAKGPTNGLLDALLVHVGFHTNAFAGGAR